MKWLINALIGYERVFNEGCANFTTDDIEEVTEHPTSFHETFACDFVQKFGGIPGRINFGA